MKKIKPAAPKPKIKKCACGRMPKLGMRLDRRMAYYVICPCGAMTRYYRLPALATAMWNLGHLWFQPEGKL